MLKKLTRLMRIHRIFIIQDLKQALEYKADFLSGLIGFAVEQSAKILFVSIIFGQIPALMGWDHHHVLFIYGFSLLPKAIDRLFFDNLWELAWHTMRKGEFDRYLTRPLNVLFHVMTERFKLDALSELTIGIVLVTMALQSVKLNLSVLNIALFLAVMPFAVFIYTGIKILAVSTAFWTKRSGHIAFMAYSFNDFARYPAGIYAGIARHFITYAVPFAFTAYYPAVYFLTGENPLFNLGGTVAAATALFGLGLLVWCKGLRAYESAGS